MNTLTTGTRTTSQPLVAPLFIVVALAVILTTSSYGQDVPPDPTNAPPTSEQIEAWHQRMLAQFATNYASIQPWLHSGYALLDGTPADFQTVMDEQALTFSANASGFSGQAQSALDEAQTWAIAVGAPTQITNVDGETIAYLIAREDGFPLYITAFNVEAAQTIATDKVWPGGTTGFNLTGTNRTISMWDERSPRLTHTEFVTNRVTELDGNTNLSGHSTAVAGTLTAAGVNDIIFMGNNLGKAAKGMSFGAKVQARDFVNDVGEMTGAVGTNTMRLSNHSYGRVIGWYQDVNLTWYWFGNSEISTDEDPKYGNYTTNTASYDQIVQNAPTYLSVWAAGNDTGYGPPVQPTNHFEFTLSQQMIVTNTVHPVNGGSGGYDTMNESSSAKNTLTVGAVFTLTNGYAGTNSVTNAPFSSNGPTDDGRIKPDVVADGVGITTTYSGSDFQYVIGINGTSFSAPSVAGSVNLLAQFYQQSHASAPDLLASTLKGLVIHTADESGPNPGPDYRFGWGLMDTATAATLINQDATNGLKNQIKEVMLNNGQFAQFPVVSPGGTNYPLKVTITWTDPAGVPNAVTNLDNPAVKLVNDLDLRVVSPNGTTNFPWILNPDLTNQTAAARSAAATTGDDRRNNVEQVYLSNPTNGTYLVTVSHKGTLTNSQWVSILVSGNTPQPTPPLRINQPLQTATNQLAIGWPGVVGQRYQVQYVAALSASNNWQNVGPQVSARLTNVVTALPYSPTNRTQFYRVAQLP